MMYVLVEPDPTSAVGKTSTFASRDDLLKYLMKDSKELDGKTKRDLAFSNKIKNFVFQYFRGESADEAEVEAGAEAPIVSEVPEVQTSKPHKGRTLMEVLASEASSEATQKPSDLLDNEDGDGISNLDRLYIDHTSGTIDRYYNSNQHACSKELIKQMGEKLMENYYCTIPSVDTSTVVAPEIEPDVDVDDIDMESTITSITAQSKIQTDEFQSFMEERKAKANTFGLTHGMSLISTDKASLGSHYESMKALRNWFVDTFCTVDSTGYYFMHKTEYQQCCRLFVYAHTFCGKDPSMIDTPVEFPPEIRYVEEYYPDVIINFLKEALTAIPHLKIKHDCFKLYKDMVHNSAKTGGDYIYSDFITNTLIAYANNKVSKGILRKWIGSFIIKRTQHNKGVHTKSSDMYKEWVKFLKTIAGEGTDTNTRLKEMLLKVSSIRDFSKEMKTQLKMGRRGAGMFYLDTGIIPEDISVANSTKTEYDAFDSTDQYSYVC
jgi:hypothetical protein